MLLDYGESQLITAGLDTPALRPTPRSLTV